VKCRLIAKAARELLRGSFANISVEAASLSEVLVGLVQNDEDAPLDIDLVAEMALKVWWQQVRAACMLGLDPTRHSMLNPCRNLLVAQQLQHMHVCSCSLCVKGLLGAHCEMQGHART
jgi:hypothetical protein